MKKIYLIIFVLLVSCSSTKKVYICGDHECKNKSEKEDYFKNNISLEVYILENKKDIKKNQDLVKLNTNIENKQNIKKKNLNFLEKRKIQSKKNPTSEKPIKMKLKSDSKVDKNMPVKKHQLNNDKLKFNNEKSTFTTRNTTKVIHMCKNLNECDIDVISNKINNLGKQKNYPKISF